MRGHGAPAHGNGARASARRSISPAAITTPAGPRRRVLIYSDVGVAVARSCARKAARRRRSRRLHRPRRAPGQRRRTRLLRRPTRVHLRHLQRTDLSRRRLRRAGGSIATCRSRAVMTTRSTMSHSAANCRRSSTRSPNRAGPALAIYNAGTDVLAGDPLGHLRVSAEGILRRDQFVLTQLSERQIPWVVLPSGGYTRESYRLIADSIAWAMRTWADPRRCTGGHRIECLKGRMDGPAPMSSSDGPTIFLPILWQELPLEARVRRAQCQVRRAGRSWSSRRRRQRLRKRRTSRLHRSRSNP